jgi:ATP-binding cassette, subfamily B, bacterial CvaB/MchF/RaxB
MQSFSRVPVVIQTEAAECGLACLAMIAGYHGHRIDLGTLRRRHPVSLKGVTLKSLIKVAKDLHFSCRALRLDLNDLTHLQLPAILHWDMDHFVVLKKVTRSHLVLHDPAYGLKRINISDVGKHLTGIAVELFPVEGFKPIDERARLRFSTLWPHMRGTSQALLQVFVLSAILELFVLASPFYLQLTIDEVIARGDADLLLVLACGFGLLTALMVVSTTIRSLILLVLQNALHLQMGARLFRHLVRLPISYFEKRHIGDVLSRFISIEPIRNVLAQGLIVGLIDGIMAVATLIMMFIYSKLLAVIVLVAFSLYVLLRLALYRMLRDRSLNAIHTKAMENSNFIETVRGIQSIKVFNREYERETQWLNRYSDVVSANVRLGRTQVTFKTLNDLLFGFENVAVIYLAAGLALDNTLTVGMIFAFMAYKMQFVEKAVQLVEKGIDFRLLELHLERLSDIALCPLEPGQERPLTYMRPIQGKIELKNVSFRYASTESFVIEKLNLTVEAGESVTIVGPSGCGKTTLVKIMLGLLEPTSGEVLIDGVPLSGIGIKAYREQTAAVMQEDELLSGTIADNICFFDSGFDQQRMFQCAQIAGIHDDLMAMPMNYNSLVGDMGSCLSSGQKQRVLLARALYHQPKILFVDEGTAHVNVEMESQIYDGLGSLKLTMICIAHRPGVLAYSDKVFRLDGGTVALISPPKAGSRRKVSFQHFQRGPFLLYSRGRGHREEGQDDQEPRQGTGGPYSAPVA